MQERIKNVSVFFGKTTNISSKIFTSNKNNTIEEEHKKVISSHIEINNQQFIYLPKMKGHSIYYCIDMNGQEVANNEIFKEYINMALKFISKRPKVLDNDSKDYYFKDEKDFCNIIKKSKQCMALIDAKVISNFTQVEGKLRLIGSNLKQQESKELQEELNKKTFTINNSTKNKVSEVSIPTTEHLKILKELSDNFYTKDVKRKMRTYTDLISYSKENTDGKFGNRNINLNMFFNDEIYRYILSDIYHPFTNVFNETQN